MTGTAVPPALRASLARHRDHLARLVGNLRVAGVDEAKIEASVTVLVESYKAELLGAIKLMLEQNFERS